MAVAVEVDLAPGTELVLDVFDPAALVDRALSLPLPPDATAADSGPARLGRSGEVLDRHAIVSLRPVGDAGDSPTPPPQAARRRSSVTSGRAKRRSGTNVVPRPGEVCMTVPLQASTRRHRARARMREPDAPAGPRQADLAAVEVSREHELDAPRAQPGQRVREVAEEDAQLRASGSTWSDGS